MNQYLFGASFFLLCFGCNQPDNHAQSEIPPTASEVSVGGSCEDCELMLEGMPGQLYPYDTLPGWFTGDKRLIIRGTIFQHDGITPAEGVVLYVYHTDASGHYRPAADQTAGRKHGQHRGWIRTGPSGSYTFYTIIPASYPGTSIEAHIHPVIKEQGLSYYYIDEYLFDDDPYLHENVRNRSDPRGGSGIIKLTPNAEGVSEGRRDIILGLNVSGYPKS